MNATKVLVVDDEPDLECLIRQTFADQIQSKEIEFIFVSNAAEALKTLNQHEEIHIILADIEMPKGDGLLLLSHLQLLNRLFRTIIISADGDLSNIRKAMNRGATDFITKPIDLKDLEITLSHAIEQCVALKKAIKAQQMLFNLERELVIAGNIQQSIIPHEFTPFPQAKSFEIYGTMIPATQVGGDFFDFFPLDEKRLGFVIGDVSGKGIPAALFMTMSRVIIRATALKTPSPEECLAEANRLLCVDNELCMFVTTFYGIYHLESGLIECANAGHNPPILLKGDRRQAMIARNQGVPLGILPEHIYAKNQLTLQKGDCLILYTDGMIEARNSEQEAYGEERFAKEISAWVPGRLPTLTTHLLDQLRQFTEERPPFDDVALLCIRQLE